MNQQTNNLTIAHLEKSIFQVFRAYSVYTLFSNPIISTIVLLQKSLWFHKLSRRGGGLGTDHHRKSYTEQMGHRALAIGHALGI